MKLSCIAVLLCALGVFGRAPGKMAGRVTDSEGAIIEGARILLHPDPMGRTDPDPRPEVSRKTDNRGRFEAELEPGFYDVCIMAAAFTPACKKVLIEDGKTVRYGAQLKVDPLLVQHLGDRFIKKDE